jgi:hypothetical protein
VSALVKVLLFSPNFELATARWQPQQSNIYTYLAQKDNFVLDELLKDNDTWQNTQSEMPSCLIAVGVGHGNPTDFTGQNYAVIVSTGTPDMMMLFKGKVFAPVSCLVGQQLLPTMAQKYGLGAGLGETVEYTFAYNPNVPPENDNITWLFISAEAHFLHALALNYSAQKAYNFMLQAYEANAKSIESTDPDIAQWLRYDAQNRAFFGSNDWRVDPSQPEPQEPIPDPQIPPPPPPPSPPPPPPPPPEEDFMHFPSFSINIFGFKIGEVKEEK